MKKGIIIGGAVAAAGTVLTVVGYGVKKYNNKKHLMEEISIDNIINTVVNLDTISSYKFSREVEELKTMSDEEILKIAVKVAKKHGTSEIVIGTIILNDLKSKNDKADKKEEKKAKKEEKKED